MYDSPNALPEPLRADIVKELNARLADGVDLHSQIKAAHWNIKGPTFAALHPLLETFATCLAECMDELAERAVTLGGIARGTVREAAQASNLPPYPKDVSDEVEVVRVLSDRFRVFLEGMRSTRARYAETDLDTLDLLTSIVRQFEKHGWFLQATLEGREATAPQRRIKAA